MIPLVGPVPLRGKVNSSVTALDGKPSVSVNGKQHGLPNGYHKNLRIAQRESSLRPALLK